MPILEEIRPFILKRIVMIYQFDIYHDGVDGPFITTPPSSNMVGTQQIPHNLQRFLPLAPEFIR